jgi:hypothetical protein
MKTILSNCKDYQAARAGIDGVGDARHLSGRAAMDEAHIFE